MNIVIFIEQLSHYSSIPRNIVHELIPPSIFDDGYDISGGDYRNYDIDIDIDDDCENENDDKFL